jgi:hypothetical protein
MGSWVQPPFVFLCLCLETLRLAEAEQLQRPDMVNIFTVHERVQTKLFPATTDAVAEDLQPSVEPIVPVSDAARASPPLSSDRSVAVDSESPPFNSASLAEDFLKLLSTKQRCHYILGLTNTTQLSEPWSSSTTMRSRSSSQRKAPLPMILS